MHHMQHVVLKCNECVAESQELVASRNEVPFMEAVKAAMQQATQSYAPYSHCPSGLAIATAGGAVYSGPYLESAAYNPSLGPLQAAIVDAVTDGIAYYTEVNLSFAAQVIAISSIREPVAVTCKHRQQSQHTLQLSIVVLFSRMHQLSLQVSIGHQDN